MKLKVLLFSTVIFLPIMNSSYAKKYTYHLPKPPKYDSSLGKTHNVRPYFKKDGTFVPSHRAGNPRSGIHCRNNICS